MSRWCFCVHHLQFIVWLQNLPELKEKITHLIVKVKSQSQVDFPMFFFWAFKIYRYRKILLVSMICPNFVCLINMAVFNCWFWLYFNAKFTGIFLFVFVWHTEFLTNENSTKELVGCWCWLSTWLCLSV